MSTPRVKRLVFIQSGVSIKLMEEAPKQSEDWEQERQEKETKRQEMLEEDETCRQADRVIKRLREEEKERQKRKKPRKS